jgi:hypothetical protein
MKNSHFSASPFYVNRPLSKICQIFASVPTLSYHKTKGNSRKNKVSWLNEKVYNPFDILLFLREKQFRSYWFETGTPIVTIPAHQRYY